MKNKKNLMLMVPMLHQGGFERVCVATARLMQDYYNVYILIFSSKDINYDVSGLEVIDIDVPAKKGVVNKIINVFKRVIKVKKLKKELGIDIAYSFGGSANYVNVLSKGKEKVLTGLRCQTDMENEKQVRLFCSRSDQVLSCSKEIMRQLHNDFNYDKSSYIYNPLDVEDIREKGKEAVSDYPFSEGDYVIASMGRNDYIKGMWHLVKAFSLPPESAAGVMLVGCCPGGTSSNVMSFLGKGDVPLSVTITACTTLLAPVVTPALFYLFASQWLDISPVAMFFSIINIVILPIVGGVIVNLLFRNLVKNAVVCLPMVSVFAIIAIVCAVVAVSSQRLAQTGLIIFCVVALHNCIGYVFGYLLGKIFNYKTRQKKTLAIEVGMQNSGLSVALANNLAASGIVDPVAAVPGAIFSVWHNISGPVIATIFANIRNNDGDNCDD